MQDCWQKSTAAGFIHEKMITATKSDTGKTSLKINCTNNLAKSIEIITFL